MAKKNSAHTGKDGNEEASAFAAALFADDKKAEDIVIMDVREISPVTDFYVLCTATSLPHLRAIRNEIRDRFWMEHDRKPLAADENMDSLWIILHYGDVMIHIFHKDKREFYALEELWGDAPRIAWVPPAPPIKEVVKTSTKKAAAKKTAVKKVAAKKAAAKPAAAAKKAVAKKATTKKTVAKKVAAKKAPAKKTAR